MTGVMRLIWQKMQHHGKHICDYFIPEHMVYIFVGCSNIGHYGSQREMLCNTCHPRHNVDCQDITLMGMLPICQRFIPPHLFASVGQGHFEQVLVQVVLHNVSCFVCGRMMVTCVRYVDPWKAGAVMEDAVIKHCVMQGHRFMYSVCL